MPKLDNIFGRANELVSAFHRVLKENCKIIKLSKKMTDKNVDLTYNQRRASKHLTLSFPNYLPRCMCTILHCCASHFQVLILLDYLDQPK